MDDIFKVVSLVGAIIAIVVSLIGTYKVFSDVTTNKRKQLREDYDALLLALQHTDVSDENKKNIEDLAETKKYQLIVGIPTIHKDLAQYLLSKSDKSVEIYRYRRSTAYVKFINKEEGFRYTFGLKTAWFRTLKKWLSLVLYIICFLLASVPIFFWPVIDPHQAIYKQFVVHNTLEKFWVGIVVWILIFFYLSFVFVNYGAKVHFAEKLVEGKKDRIFWSKIWQNIKVFFSKKHK